MSSFSLPTLAAYVDQTNIDLIKQPLLKNKSATLFTLAAGIKNGEQLPLLKITSNYTDGSQCGSPLTSGSAAISGRTISIGKVKSTYKFCLKELEPYFTSQMLAKGSHQETFSAEADIVQQAQATIMKDLEIAIWQASTVASASAGGVLPYFDGFLRIIENASGSYVNATGSVAGGNLITGSISATNVRQLIEQNVYANIDMSIIDDPKTAVFCGRDTAILYTRALANANLFNAVGADTPDSITIYGSNGMKLIPVNGLNGTSKVVALNTKYAFVGVDLATDYTDNFQHFYVPQEDTVYLRWDFKYGTQVAFPDQIVYAFIH
jgi:hypothetical protein